MSTFEDLLSMKTRAFLVKDIDPEILKRLLGNRSLATELSDEQLNDYYSNKVPKPTNSSELLNLMSKGGGLDRKWENPRYAKKLAGIDHKTIETWVRELASQGKITKLRATGSEDLMTSGSQLTWQKFTELLAALRKQVAKTWRISETSTRRV